MVIGTQEGIYARIKKHPDKFIMHATLPGRERETFSVDIGDVSGIKKIAEEGGVWSYAAGKGKSLFVILL